MTIITDKIGFEDCAGTAFYGRPCSLAEIRAAAAAGARVSVDERTAAGWPEVFDGRAPEPNRGDRPVFAPGDEAYLLLGAGSGRRVALRVVRAVGARVNHLP